MSRKFKEYRVEDLFFIKSNLQLNKDSFVFVKKHDKKCYPYFTRTEQNNGIAGYVEYLDEEHKIAGNSIAVGMLGMRFFYMESDFYAGQFTKTIFPKFPEFNKKIAQYFITWFNKKEKVYKGFLVRDFEKMFYNTTLSLPVTSTGSIDYAYMEEYISELEEECINELEEERINTLKTYLNVANLNDILLTDEEQNAIEIFNNGSIIISEYKVDDLFEVKSNPQLNKDSFVFVKKHDKKCYPYFTRTEQNNGIAGYVEYLDEEHKIAGNSIAVGMLGMRFFYMESDFYAGQFTKTIFPKFPEFNKKIAQYFIVLLNKNKNVYQGHLVRDFENLLNNTILSLPTKNNAPDFDFMETYINAIQKLVIKDIIDSKDEIIHRIKKVVRN